MQKRFAPSRASEEMIVRSAANFLSPHRVTFDIGERAILDKVNSLVLDAGIPLVISEYHKHPKWDPDLFTDDGTKKEFQRHAAGKSKRTAAVCFRNGKFKFISLLLPVGKVIVREEGKNGGDIKMPFDDFWKAIKTEGCPLYGKDLICGEKWEQTLQDVLPPFLVYRSIGDLSKLVCFDPPRLCSF